MNKNLLSAAISAGVFLLLFLTSLSAFSSGVEIRCSMDSDTVFSAEFKSADTKVKKFRFVFTPPEGSKIRDVYGTPGAVDFKEKWDKIGEVYRLKYEISIINQTGISSAEFRDLIKIGIDKYKLKGVCEFKLMKNGFIGGSGSNIDSEVTISGSPLQYDYGQGMPRVPIRFEPEIKFEETELIENPDSCFVLSNIYLNAENTKESIRELRFYLKVPDGVNLVRTEPLKEKGGIDKFAYAEFEKIDEYTYSVKYGPTQEQWPVEPNSHENDGRPLLRLAVHIYKLCPDIEYIFSIENPVCFDETMTQNNITRNMFDTLDFTDYYEENFIKGDVAGYCFGDKIVDNRDVEYIEKYLANLVQFNCYRQWAADINRDGEVDSQDLDIMMTGIPGLKSPELQIYPNPAGDYIHVFAPGVGTRIVLIDEQGQIVRTLQAGLNEIGDIAAGVYFVKMTGTDGRVKIEKLIVL